MDFACETSINSDTLLSHNAYMCRHCCAAATRAWSQNFPRSFSRSKRSPWIFSSMRYISWRKGRCMCCGRLTTWRQTNMRSRTVCLEEKLCLRYRKRSRELRLVTRRREPEAVRRVGKEKQRAKNPTLNSKLLARKKRDKKKRKGAWRRRRQQGTMQRRQGKVRRRTWLQSQARIPRMNAKKSRRVALARTCRG